MAAAVDETYVAAIQHDIVDVGDATLVGVVRKPTGWFRATVDENYPELGPPRALLEETRRRTEDLKRAGMCDEGAHNAAWEEVDFAARYGSYIDESEDAQNRLDALETRRDSGERLVLVCFEGEDKRCHRHLLVDRLEAGAQRP